MTTMEGYKGFKKNKDGSLECLSFKFNTKGINSLDLNKPLKLCAYGFHFCKTLKDVFEYYPFSEDNEYWHIKATSVLEGEGNKHCCHQIELIKKVSPHEIMLEVLKEKFEFYFRLQEKHPNLILGGSMALILQEVIPMRKVMDVDLALPFYEEIKGAKLTSNVNLSQNNDSLKMKLENDKFDLFIRPEVVYKTVKLPNGLEVKCQSVEQIMEAKLKYLHKGYSKHLPDLINYLQNKNTIKQEQDFSDDLPY